MRWWNSLQQLTPHCTSASLQSTPLACKETKSTGMLHLHGHRDLGFKAEWLGRLSLSMIALLRCSNSKPTSIPEPLINVLLYSMLGSRATEREPQFPCTLSGIMNTYSSCAWALVYLEIQTEWGFFCSDVAVWSSGGSHQDFCRLPLSNAATLKGIMLNKETKSKLPGGADPRQRFVYAVLYQWSGKHCKSFASPLSSP